MKQEPIFQASEILSGLTVGDLLSTEGALAFPVDNNVLAQEGIFVLLAGYGFHFRLSVQKEFIVFQRDNTVVYLKPGALRKNYRQAVLFVTWKHCELQLECRGTENHEGAVTVQTTPTAPPAQLLKWARMQTLIPVQTFASEEAFREKIHASLMTISQKIREADAYKSFWNISYQGNTIVDRRPKKEVEIQPIIHCLLSDQMLMSNIEIAPEYKSGEGNLDFLFIGQIQDTGSCKFCAEFKLAHSSDLDHGLWFQLPRYMQVCNANYGAYCVLSFKCDWFNRPVFEDGVALDLRLHLVPHEVRQPFHQSIRSFVFDLGKPSTASRR
jgi:hypothetical protein